MVVLDSDYVAKADTNLEDFKSETLSIGHEMKLHVMDIKEGKQENVKDQHDKGYDVKTDGKTSPNYNSIKSSSIMGKMRSKIEAAAKNKKNYEKPKSTANNFPQAQRKS